jgi:PiT family inorganic phosphate transporter
MNTSAEHMHRAVEARPRLEHPVGKRSILLFCGLLIVGMVITAWGIFSDVDQAGTVASTWLPYGLLGLALLIALGFEFVNGFHDTANAVATVIYTHSLPANVAVVWSGFCNFAGVLFSSGAVAFGIIALLPIDMILQVGSSNGFAMIFALLIAAIIWNLGTWWFGLPASSSHTLIGSILGVQRLDQRPPWQRGRGLESSHQGRLHPAAVTDRGLCLRRPAADAHARIDQATRTVPRTGRQPATAGVDSRAAGPHL